MRWTLIPLAFVLASPAFADEFESWNSNHQELKETAILEIGDVEKLQPPPSKRWTYDVLKIADTCVQLKRTYSEYWSYGKKAGLLVVDRFLYYKLAFIDSAIGQKFKVTLVAVEIVECQTILSDRPTSVEKTLSDLKKSQELSRRRQEAGQRELERLKQQQQKLNQ